MKRHHHTLVAVSASLALLAGCGGHSRDAPAPAPSPLDAVPPEASQSAAGLKRYLEALAATPADDREPVGLTGFTPPLSDDTEPEPLG